MKSSKEIARRLTEDLPGRDQVKALLAASGLTLTEFARQYGHWKEDVSKSIAGDSRFPKIREDIAKALELPRDEINRLIDGALP